MIETTVLLFLGMVVVSVLWLTLGVVAVVVFEQIFDKEIYDHEWQCFIPMFESRKLWWLRLLIILSGVVGFILSVLLWLIKVLIEIVKGH